MKQTLTKTAVQVDDEAPFGSHRLKSLTVIGGFLDGAAFDLSEGLNCIIGARGTGKTTVLELVRFALDALPAHDEDPDERRRIESLIAQNLAGGRVELTIETKDGLTYTVTRTEGEDPIVLDADGQATELTLGNGGLFSADIYSQNEVERIADRSLSQLNLIDNFNAEQIENTTNEIRHVQHSLAANAGQIGPLQGKIATLTEELGALPGVEEKLKGYVVTGGQDAKAINQTHELKALRDRERRAVDEMAERLTEFEENLGTYIGGIAEQATSIFSGDLGAGPNAAALTAVRKAMLDCSADVDRAVDTAVKRIKTARGLLMKAAQTLAAAHNQQELAFRALIEQHQAAQSKTVERTRLERTRNELLTKRRSRDELTQKLEALKRQRAELLRKLSDLRDRRFSIRRQVGGNITTAMKGSIRVSVTQAGDPSAYRDLLMRALKNAGLKPALVTPKLVNAFWPAQLADAVRSGDSRPLVEEADLSEAQARKVMESLAGSDTLFELETVELNDLPKIELNDNGEFKESQALSTGQKCTTILPILMLESDRPLLIDQPEDNLDNRFIFECVVNRIREIKGRRQLTFVTHNPNIPVLGDADKVFVLDSDGSTARLTRYGTVDECKSEIVTLLEGGEEAFLQRQKRYAYGHA